MKDDASNKPDLIGDAWKQSESAPDVSGWTVLLLKSHDYDHMYDHGLDILKNKRWSLIQIQQTLKEQGIATIIAPIQGPLSLAEAIYVKPEDLNKAKLMLQAIQDQL
jgi:hypothetical protein